MNSANGQVRYSEGGAVLESCPANACAGSGGTFTVQPGCRVIGQKAFAYLKNLHEVILPDSLERIDKLAFVASGIKRVTCPPSLRVIAESAFLGCSSLAEIELNDGLEEIGDEAFAHCTALESLAVPATVRALGKNPIRDTSLATHAPDPTFSIDAANPCFTIDDQGVVYRIVEDGAGKGTVLVAHDCLDERLADCVLDPRCVEVENRAFAHHPSLKSVTFPEGLVRIGDSAFFNCGRLVAVSFPSTLEFIGARAFRDTQVELFDLPSGIAEIGDCAFCTKRYTPAISGFDWQTAPLVQLADGNPHFEVSGGVLYRKDDEGRIWQAMQYVGPDVRVSLKPGTREIASMAFGGVRNLEELVIPASVRKVGPSGLAMCDVPRRIEVGLAKPVGDNTSAVMYPVNDFYGMRAMTAAFSEGYIDPFSMQRSFDRAATCTAGMFERSRYIASRLADPFRLLAGLSDYFKQEILRDRERVFEAFCNHDYRRGFDQLVDAGLIDENDLSLAIEVAGRMDNVAMSSYLLDLKHRSFAIDNDYGL